jgi:hypothetical protein
VPSISDFDILNSVKQMRRSKSVWLHYVISSIIKIISEIIISVLKFIAVDVS